MLVNWEKDGVLFEASVRMIENEFEIESFTATLPVMGVLNDVTGLMLSSKTIMDKVEQSFLEIYQAASAARERELTADLY